MHDTPGHVHDTIGHDPGRRRDRADACPGALQTYAAADGGLARVRLPGGALAAGQLRVLLAAARELGDGMLELTSRGNVQLRGLRAGAEVELGERLDGAALLPSPTHERVRNIVASMLSGRSGGRLDVRTWVHAYDAGLCADPVLAGLPGRFLVTLDDGRGDVAALAGDVGLMALSASVVALTLAGVDAGLRTTGDGGVALALAATRAFLAERAAQGGTAWRLAELADGPSAVGRRLRGGPVPWSALPPSGVLGAPPPPAPPVCGVVAQDDGRWALVAVVPLGRLTQQQGVLLAGVCDDLQVTPWRSVVVADLPDPGAAAALARAGLVLDPASAWPLVTACAGRPGCARSLADVRSDAATAVATGTLPAGAARQHWAGCERRCGRPPGHVVDVVATGDGYRVGPPEDADP